MGKHRHKKSFYDVDEDDLESSRRHHHHRRRRRHSSEKQDETKQRVPSMLSFNNSKSYDDESALQSPPIKRQRSSPSSSSNNPQSASKVLSQLIENPEFLANAGPKAREFAETARQLLAKPNLDPTTQQIICAMAQAAVNVGKRLNFSSLVPADQCVDETTVTNSTTYSSSALLSPTLSNTSSSSTSTTPQQQSHSILSYEEKKTSTETETDEDILIKQMIGRAMKLTQQGDTRHAQHLLGIIHEKLSNKRKRDAAAASASSNSNDNEKIKMPLSNDFYSLPSLLDEEIQNHHHNNNKISPSESEQSNDYQNTNYFSYPPPPPLPPPPPPPPPPSSDINSTESVPITVSRIEQVQELLSNPSEVQDILKKLFSTNENPKFSPPEEYQMQSHLISPSSFYSHPSIPFNNTTIYPPSSCLNNQHQPLRVPPPSQPSTPIVGPQPYNSSLAFMQGNRRNLPPLQTPDRCFSSSNNKNNNQLQQQPNRSFSYSSSSSAAAPSNNNGIMPFLANPAPPPLSAPPLMKVNPSFQFPSSVSNPYEMNSSRWSNNNEQQQRGFHPFWCATCALGFPHQIAYQEHLGSHILCNVPGCSYTASEQLVRIHYQNIHENNARSRINNNIPYQTRPIQQSLEPPWSFMRM
ncbi:unnamed protein product [Adineta steineri]|uniref:C2H2-type domain-containing protein n=1 Tax=Adineta steineri TaxID=433720 RepID=A0A814CDK9_9BILA|nr:unnamed protein product [Adineta steineri]CAF3726486.1 unnamed protein product [Adineta steineri]